MAVAIILLHATHIDASLFKPCKATNIHQMMYMSRK